MHPLSTDHSRLSAGSDTSLLSADSGYASMTPEAESPTTSKAGKRRQVFVLPSLGFFKRKEKAAVHLEIPKETRHGSDWPAPLRAKAPTHEPATAPSPVTESLTV